MRIELDGDERVVVRTRPHPRALRGAAWAFMILMLVFGFAAGLVSRLPELGGTWADAAPYLSVLVLLLLALTVVAWVVRPLWRWWRTRIVITTYRILLLRGRRRDEIPLGQVLGVGTRPGLGSRQDAPGTLVLNTSRGEARLVHVPDVRRAALLVRGLCQRLPWIPRPGYPGAGGGTTPRG